MSEEDVLEWMEEDIGRSFSCDMRDHSDVAAPWAVSTTRTVCELCGSVWNYLMCLTHTAVLRRDAERGMTVPCGACRHGMPLSSVKVDFL